MAKPHLARISVRSVLAKCVCLCVVCVVLGVFNCVCVVCVVCVLCVVVVVCCVCRFRVVYGGWRVGQIIPSLQNREMSALAL